MPAKIRKLIVQVDETRIEMGQPVSPPTRRAVAIAVIHNPFAGRYEASHPRHVQKKPPAAVLGWRSNMAPGAATTLRSTATT